MISATGILVSGDQPLMGRLALAALLTIPVGSAVAALTWGGIWLLVPWFGAVLILAFCQPRIGLLILIVAWFFRINILGIPGVYPADVVLLPVVAGYLCRRLATGGRIADPTPVNRVALVWLGLYAVSLLGAVDLAFGVKNWLRHIELFALFVAAVGLLDRTTIRRVVVLFLGLCIGFSVFNIARFVLEGGTIRAFGTAHTLFSGYLALAVAPATALALLSTQRRHRRFWTAVIVLFIMAQIANQSRGAMLQLFTGFLFTAFIAYRWGAVNRQAALRKRLLKMGAVLAVAGVLAMVMAGGSIQRAAHRYSTESGSDLYTLQTRNVLWRSAIRLFLDHPILGVGPAQTLSLRAYLPDIRLNPIYHGIKGLGTHNSLLRYLAECGIVGSLVLWMLLWRALSFGRGIIRAVRDPVEAAWQIGLWGIVFVLISRFLYEGHIFYSISGMTTVVFVAMLYRMRHPRSACEDTR
ncbi:MAG TPA: O-antigen ligase family protein [Acidobacteriota bacterium]|nr:O-antigen ligase family protein [Acidobacteriota bacterium]